MPHVCHTRTIAPALALALALAFPTPPAGAATFLEFVDPNPTPGNQFGSTVVVLGTGNVVVTSPFDDAGGMDAGAVYLFDGVSGALLSTLLGSTPGDQIGSGGVTALTDGNFVVRSPNWDNGGRIGTLIPAGRTLHLHRCGAARRSYRL